jgi:hypothetical protein
MSNKLFDTLRFLQTVLLPAIGTLYFALADIWHLPYAPEVVGTVTSLTAFLGAFVEYKRQTYKGDNNGENV